MALNQLFWKLTKENLPFMRLILEEQQKYLQSFINNATYHPMNPDADVTYQTVNLFSSDKCFIYFISDVPHYIRSNQHNTVCTILVKVDVLDTCGAMICSYFGIALFFMKIENTVYTSFQTSTLLFINGLIFDITNIQNNQSLECYHQCYHPLDLSMIKDFHGFVMFSLSLSNSVRQCHRNFTKVACQKMFIT